MMFLSLQCPVRVHIVLTSFAGKKPLLDRNFQCNKVSPDIFSFARQCDVIKTKNHKT